MIVAPGRATRSKLPNCVCLTDARVRSVANAGRSRNNESAQREIFDLTNLVQEVVADGDFEARAQDREVKLIHADPCAMFGVPEMLRSAIENVVRNAIRHTPAQSSVEITLKQTAAEGAVKALLKVRDHGSGVPEKMLASIFLPFHQVPQSEVNSHGAGLGLAIADRVARMHEGSIQARNATDGGLIVEIVLPTKAADSAR
jgi:two-component system, OmpR family, sensor histidine kinase CpxA